jgi:hypothetical protein
VLPPYFEGPDADGVLWHYERVAASVSCEVMAYNIPQYSDFDVTPELFARIRNASGNVTCIKDSTGDMLRLELLVATGARVFNGSDYLNLYGLVAGCAGCFSGSGNAMPAQLVELYDLVMAGKLEAAAALWGRLRPASVFSVPTPSTQRSRPPRRWLAGRSASAACRSSPWHRPNGRRSQRSWPRSKVLNQGHAFALTPRPSARVPSTKAASATSK